MAMWLESTGEKYALGTSVVIKNSKIKIAQKGETPIGVVVNNATIVFNSAEEHWHGKYQKDERGLDLMVELEETKERVETVDVIVKNKIYKTRADGAVDLIYENKIIKTPVMVTQKIYDEGKLVGERRVPKMVKTVVKRKIAKVAANYNDKLSYIPRSQRPSWHLVALTGIVTILDKQIIHPNWTRIDATQFLLK